MRDACHVIAYDVGTTGAKACLYRFHDPSRPAELLASAASEYRLRLLPGGGAEQDPGDWWSGLCAATRTILGSRGVPPAAVQGIAFCCQMQGLVLVDADGTPVRPAMTYMDQRPHRRRRRAG